MKKLLLLSVVLTVSIYLCAQSSGPKSGRTFTNGYLSGAETSWVDLDNAGESDNALAVFGNLSNVIGSHTDYLVITNFRLAVPPGARISGIAVFIESLDESETTADHSIRIVKEGKPTGTDHSEGDRFFNVNHRDQYNTYGGTGDLWGEEWTAEDINSEEFGVAISASRASLGGETRGGIDDVQVTIYYSADLLTLPLRLTAFSATLKNAGVTLSWKTIEESSMDRFEIERSSNGTAFTRLGEVPCTNRALPSQYSFEDTSPLSGTAWYRLKIISINGSTTYSKIVSLYNQGVTSHYLYPSPWQKGSGLFIRNPSGERLTVIFYTLTGEMISKVTTNTHQVPTSSLSKHTGNLHYKIMNDMDRVTGSGKMMVF